MGCDRTLLTLRLCTEYRSNLHVWGQFVGMIDTFCNLENFLVSSSEPCSLRFFAYCVSSDLILLPHDLCMFLEKKAAGAHFFSILT